MAFDLRALRYFVQVVELGSLSRAARALNIAQPALSQSVAGLEDHLGAQLLIRSSHGVEVTATGRELYDRAREVLEKVHGIEQDLTCHRDALQGNITIGMPAPAANVLLEPLATRVNNDHPDLKIRIEEARTSTLIDGLLSGQYDLAVTASLGNSGRIHGTELAMESLHLVGAAAAGLSGSICFDMLMALPMILSTIGDTQNSMLNRATSGRGKPLKIAFESSSLATTKRLVATGEFYSIMTWSAAAEAIASGALSAAQIVDPVLPRPLYLCQVHDRRHSRAAQILAREIEDIAQQMTAAGVFR